MAERFGELLGKPARIIGQEAGDALLNNAQRAQQLFGPPRVSADRLTEWIADWVARGMPSLGKDTHYDTRHGDF